jgi:hypothetical protein
LVEAGQACHLGATFHATFRVKSPTAENYAQSASLSNCAIHTLKRIIHLIIAIGISLITVSRKTGWLRRFAIGIDRTVLSNELFSIG